MKWVIASLLLFLVNAITGADAQTCPPVNIGFEDGTFNHWQCDTGHLDRNGVLHLTPSPPIPTRQTMIDKNYAYPTDYWGGFPTLCPNGSGHSIQLGNGDEDEGTLAERVSYTFTVPAGENVYSLIFNYAMVLQYNGDNRTIAPRFSVKTYDITDGAYIDCSSYDFFALPGQPQWKLSALGSDAYYQDWTTAAINLNGYAGKQIRLEFTTNHYGIKGFEVTPYGYAYIDVNENCASPITGNAYCTGQPSVTLTSPPGFYSYVWYKAADLSKPVGHNSMLTISPPPPDKTGYAVVTQSMGCFDTLYTVVSKVDAGFVFKVKDTVYTCSETPADLTAAGVTAGSSPGLNYTYYNDSTTLYYLYHPDKIAVSGTYYIKAQSDTGCSNILPVTLVVLNSQAVKVTDPPAMVYPATVDLSGSFTHQSNFVYSYYSNNTGTLMVNDFQHVGVSGTYYIKAFNTLSGCSTLVPVTVTITPPPVSLVKAVNAFTPNHDGINDYFSINIVGADLFRSLKIFNRYGQLVFETTSNGGYWDGNTNGKQAQAGTYYWVVEGIYTYDHSTVYQSGYVTLIR